MSELATATKIEPRLIGVLAEFDSPEALLAAGAAAREEGYRQLETFTPFPVHGVDQAIGVRPTPLPWLVLAAGLGGAALALLLQWFTNARDYPFLISGKPLFSLPANIPVTFEVIILASAITAFLGVLGLNKLPQFSNPLFASERFRRASSDRFFLLIRAADPRFAEAKTTAWLQTVGPLHIESCWESGRGFRIPRLVFSLGLIAAALALLPPLFLAKSRATTSETPRWYLFGEMFFQPKFKTQTTSTLFTDGRAMRPPVAGTVARGQLAADERLCFGIAPGPVVVPAGAKPDPTEKNWTKTVPEPIAEELKQRGDQFLQRGRERFNIFCANCHGRAGYGDGVVSQRALRLQQGTWLQPTSLHSDPVRQQPVGKLFDTISNGIRKMPAYGEQISIEDRWAIVLYVRALQRSQQAVTPAAAPAAPAAAK